MSDNISNESSKGWCHTCKKNIFLNNSSSSSTLICPNCNGEFIEFIEDNEEDSSQNNFSQNNSSQNNFSQNNFSQNNSSPNISNNTTSLNNSTNNNPNNTNMNQPPFFPFFQQLRNIQNPLIPPPFETSNNIPNHQNRIVFHFQSGDNINLENLFSSFFGGLPPGSMNQFFQSFGIHGNPADYAWGRNFEDILNQLFQNTNHKGNPPASEETIKSLVETNLEQKQIDEHLDCPICKDEFTLEDHVIKLPCQHIFHPSCIIKWLKMRNQCPVCR